MKNYRSKIYLFLYVSLVIVLGSFAILFVNFRKQVGLQNKILVIENNLIQADSLINNLLQIEADKRGFQLTADVTYLKNFYRIKTGCRVNIQKLRTNSIESKDLLFIARIDSMVSVCLTNLENCIVVYRTEGALAATAYMQEPDKRNTREILGDDLATLKNRFQQQLQTTTLGINQRGNRNVGGLLMLLLVFVLLMLVAARTFRRAQKKMFKNHYKFKEAQRIAKIGSWEWEFATNRLKWSPEQFRLFGEDRKEFDLTYPGYLEHLAPPERKRTEALIREAIEGKAKYEIEHEIIHRDGSVLMVFEQGTVLYDEKTGLPVGMFGTTQDISDRVKAAESLRKSEERHRQIVETAQEGIWVLDENNCTIFINKKMCDILGYSQEEMMGRKNYDFKDEEGKIKAMEDIERRKKGVAETLLSKFISKTGQEIWTSVSTNPIFDDAGKYIGALGMFTDITYKKKADEALEAIRRKYQLIFDNTADGIYQSTINGKFIMVNPSMARIFGYDSAEQMISSVTNIGEQLYADPDERKAMSALLTEQGHVEDYDIRVLTRSGDVIWVSANIRIVKDEKGQPAYFEGALEDITRRKAAEEEILQLNRNLDQFANITAHDLQEPIRMVSGFLGLLDKKYGQVIDEQGKSYILRAKDGADRMSILIRDLLEYSRSGNKAAKVEPVDLKYVLDLVHQDMEIVMDKTDATLLIPNSLPVVEGTQSALYRLFLNLVSNGIKFKKKDTAPEVRISVQDTGDHWEFSVEDNGIGVAEKDQPKLFQAFQRLHRREDYPGTGLGLVTCKKIVEMHGGKIWMSSEFGKGTTFHFTISKIPGMIAEQTINLRRA